MTIFLAMAVFAASTSAAVEDASAIKPSTVAIICTAAGARVSGLTKVCYYKCARSEGALTTRLYEHCPSWTPHWRLNQNRQFGPSGISR